MGRNAYHVGFRNRCFPTHHIHPDERIAGARVLVDKLTEPPGVACVGSGFPATSAMAH